MEIQTVRIIHKFRKNNTYFIEAHSPEPLNRAQENFLKKESGASEIKFLKIENSWRTYEVIK